MIHDIECAQCDGEGWREPTADEASDMAEAQYHDRNSGEPPMTLREQNTAAWMLKQALRS
jgi:hypothetical protein